MKIALITPGGVDRSGRQRVIPRLLWLIERLAREHEVHVFALRQEPRPSTYALLGATVHNVGARPRRLRALAMIAHEHARGRFNVLHAWWIAPQGVIATVAGRLLDVPILLHPIGGDLADLPKIDYGLLRLRRGRAWLRATTRSADLVCVETREMQRRAAALGVTSVLVPQGIALDAWPVAAPRTEVRTPARLLHVADINRVKDQATLLEAFARLRPRVEATLDLVGLDTLHGALQQLAEQLGVAAYVRFHGFRAHAELRSFYERADLFVLSSLYESGPMCTLEAAIAGVPIVSTEVGHLIDWSPHAALTVEPGNAVALADAMERGLTDPALRAALARNAQRLAISENADRAAAATVALYHRLVNRRSVVSLTA